MSISQMEKDFGRKTRRVRALLAAEAPKKTWRLGGGGSGCGPGVRCQRVEPEGGWFSVKIS